MPEMRQPRPLPALLLLLCCPWGSASESGLCWVSGGSSGLSAASGSCCSGVSCRCSAGSDCGGPRGAAALPPVHGVPEDSRAGGLWGLPGGP